MADLTLYNPNGKLVLGRAGVELWISDDDGTVRACFLPDGVGYNDEMLSLAGCLVLFRMLKDGVLKVAVELAGNNYFF